MSYVITSNTIKMFHEELCHTDDEGYDAIRSPYCAAEPEPIDLGNYSFLGSLVPSWAKSEEQLEIQICQGLASAYDEYESGDRVCTSSKVTDKEECEKRLKRLRVLKGKCDDEVLYPHEVASDWRALIWAGIIVIGGALLKVIWWLVRRTWLERKDPRDAMAEAFKAIDRIRRSSGWKNKLIAIFGGIVNVARRSFGAPTTQAEKIRDEAIQAVVEKWPQTRAKLGTAHQALQEFLEGLGEDIHPRKLSDIRDSDLRPVIGTTDGITLQQIANNFLIDKQFSGLLLNSYQRTMKVVEERLATIISGQLLPNPDRLPTADEVRHAMEETERYKDAAIALSDANDSLQDVLNIVASVETVDPQINADWLHTMLETKALLQGIAREIKRHSDFLEMIDAELAKHESAKVMRILKLYHGIESSDGLLLKVESVSSELAHAMGVSVNVDSAREGVAIPRAKQIPLFIILSAMLNNSINFSDPKARYSAAKVGMRAALEDGDLVFSIVDNGVGIKDLGNVIRGGTLSRERPDLAPGLGVALRDAYMLAQKHGIRIGYRKRTSLHFMSAGTEFKVRVQLAGSGGPSARLEMAALPRSTATGTSAGALPAYPSPDSVHRFSAVSSMQVGGVAMASNMGVVPRIGAPMSGFFGVLALPPCNCLRFQ